MKFTGGGDRQDMMERIGIKTLRLGSDARASGHSVAENWPAFLDWIGQFIRTPRS